MSLLCPNCRKVVDADTRACANGHSFVERAGVLILLGDAFARRLAEFTRQFAAIRAGEGKRLTDASAYEDLPHSQWQSPDAAWRAEWRARVYDLEIVDRLLPKGCRVLDVGAWNGWLSHRLTLRGHEVTAVDYFVDEHDGLGARRHYSTRWRAIQIDLADLSVLGERFDVIILNRCLQFFPDPAAYVAHTRRMLAAGGVLIATGLLFFRDPRSKALEVELTRRRYRERHDFDLFLRPTKAYLDFADRDHLRADGMTFRHYPQLWRSNLKSILAPGRPRHMWGVCRAEAT